MNKKISEKILLGIALVLIVGFKIGVHLMDEDVKSESHKPIVVDELHRPAEITIDGSARTPKQFEAVKKGMTYAQVLKALHIKRLSKNMDAYLQHSTVVLKFVNPDTSSSEVTLRAGYVRQIEHFTIGMNRAKAEAESDEGQ